MITPMDIHNKHFPADCGDTARKKWTHSCRSWQVTMNVFTANIVRWKRRWIQSRRNSAIMKNGIYYVIHFGYGAGNC